MKDTPPPPSVDAQTPFKTMAAEYAVGLIQPGMTVGLGSGSTALFALRRIGALLRAGGLHDIMGFATSQVTRMESERLGIPLMHDDLPAEIDMAIDGADEVDPALNVIKGGGGALLREKIVAQASRREVIIVDETKWSPRLGTRHVLPVEVVQYGWRSQARFLESLGARVVVRDSQQGVPFLTDSGNMILDGDFGPIEDVHVLADRLSRRAGIVEHGLFVDLVTDVIVAGKDGLRHLKRQG